MRYVAIASQEDIDDFIDISDLDGDFICTSFQTFGISRKLDFLQISNRQLAVENKPEFKKYKLTIEILSKYSEYEEKYQELALFFDRNKKCGIKLFFAPHRFEYYTDDVNLRYCLCDIERVEKTDKLKPVVITLVQNSMWLGIEKTQETSLVAQSGNIFAFSQDADISGYYAATFAEDEDTSDFYCVTFYNGKITSTTIENKSYNEIPLNFIINAPCTNPLISIYKDGEGEPIRQLQVLARINVGYIEINSNIIGNGVFYKKNQNSEGVNYISVVNNALGSPYIYVDHGRYYIEAKEANLDACNISVVFQEEYSE